MIKDTKDETRKEEKGVATIYLIKSLLEGRTKT